MRIQSIVAGAAIALIAGVGSVSADELTVADSAANQGMPFAMLDGIETFELSVQEMAATRGAALVVYLNKVDMVDDPESVPAATLLIPYFPVGTTCARC
jgi:translation elongation factor EF-Tu-like GTPase